MREQLCEEGKGRKESGSRRGERLKGGQDGERRGKGRELLSQPPAVGNLSHSGIPSPAEAPDTVKHREDPLFCALFEFLALNCEM